MYELKEKRASFSQVKQLHFSLLQGGGDKESAACIKCIRNVMQKEDI